MSNTPSLTPKDLIKLLLKWGYIFDRAKGSHQIYIHPKTHKRAIIPMHTKDLPTGTLMAILKQAGIDKSELTNI
jgi:predicted RNA binding protein YcfA (HicA-like mRNA interferase family)